MHVRQKRSDIDFISGAICVPIKGGGDDWCQCLAGESGSDDGGGRPITAPTHTTVKREWWKICG